MTTIYYLIKTVVSINLILTLIYYDHVLGVIHTIFYKRYLTYFLHTFLPRCKASIKHSISFLLSSTLHVNSTKHRTIISSFLLIIAQAHAYFILIFIFVIIINTIIAIIYSYTFIPLLWYNNI